MADPEVLEGKVNTDQKKIKKNVNFFQKWFIFGYFPPIWERFGPFRDTGKEQRNRDDDGWKREREGERERERERERETQRRRVFLLLFQSLSLFPPLVRDFALRPFNLPPESSGGGCVAMMH